jgi:hypothetical protein
MSTNAAKANRCTARQLQARACARDTGAFDGLNRRR